MWKGLIIWLVLLGCCIHSADLMAQFSIIPSGSIWKYYDKGDVADSTWAAPLFEDSLWSSGCAILGYGNGNECTLVSYGGNVSQKYITTYFRKGFFIKNIYDLEKINLLLKRDDGAVVYVNGIEVCRSNMPAGKVANSTLAQSAADDGKVFNDYEIPLHFFRTGKNLIAVEIHQTSPSSSDIAFDLELSGKLKNIDPKLISNNSIWKYYSENILPATDWFYTNYDDQFWNENTAPFGWNDAIIQTALPLSPTTNSFYRKIFYVSDVVNWENYHLQLKVNDGAAIFINDSLVFKINLPDGAYSTSLNALSAGDFFIDTLLSPHLFKPGLSTIAVSLHQSSVSDSKALFDFQLTANVSKDSFSIVSGPYVGCVNQHSATIQWVTNIPTDENLMFGIHPDSLFAIQNSNILSCNHKVTFDSLRPFTKYYFRIKSADSLSFFITAPEKNARNPYRFLIMGDMGVNSIAQINLQNEIKKKVNGDIHQWILLGDNAYSSGLEIEYEQNFFNIYDQFLCKVSSILAIPGNHDYANKVKADSVKYPFFQTFCFPEREIVNGRYAKNPSFYASYYGNVKFIALDAYGIDSMGKVLTDVSSVQYDWLKNELQKQDSDWKIVCIHHPPYSKGSHDGDIDIIMSNVRKQLLPLFDQYGVDMVLSGHSHNYERSYPVYGYYGISDSFKIERQSISSLSGFYKDNQTFCPYVKTDEKGIIYAVVGSSGNANNEKSLGYPHKAMAYSNVENAGALLLNVHENRLDAQWLCDDGVVRDQFSLFKKSKAPQILTAQYADNVSLKASWPATNFIWTNGAIDREINFTFEKDTMFVVSDVSACLADTFIVKQQLGTYTLSHQINFQFMPNPVQKGRELLIHPEKASGQFFMELYDSNGQKLRSESIALPYQLSTDILPSGFYIIRLTNDQHQIFTGKIIIVN